MDFCVTKGLLKTKVGFISMFVLLIMLVMDFPVLDIPMVRIKPAEARIGRPLTPASVGGVRRRTRRRTHRRTAAVVSATRVYALPGGCVTTIAGGTKYYHCGGTYYRPYYEGETVVYVVESP